MVSGHKVKIDLHGELQSLTDVSFPDSSAPGHVITSKEDADTLSVI